MIYRDRLLGDDFAGNMFTSEPAHNLVHRRVVSPNGATFATHQASGELKAEFLSSTDSWFRPATIRTGPDGAIWLADIYRFVIEHPDLIEEQVQQRIDLRAGADRGRIYRISPIDRPTRPIVDMTKQSPEALVALLKSPNGPTRDRAQQQLLWRDDKSIVPLLRKLSTQSESALERLHSLCTLEGLGELDDATLQTCLADEAPGVRRHAVRIAADRTPPSSAMLDAFLRMADEDDDPHVRLEVAYALGGRDDPRAGATLVQMALAEPGDIYMKAAALSSIDRTTAPSALAAAFSQRRPGADELIQQLLGVATAYGDSDALPKALRTVLTPNAQGGYDERQFTALIGVFDAIDRLPPGAVEPFSWNEPNDELTQAARATLRAAKAIVGDPSASESTRIAAAGLLGRTPDEREADATLLAKLVAPAASESLQLAAIARWARIGEPLSAQVLLSNWPQLKATQAAVVEALLLRPSTAARLIEAIQSKAIQPDEFSAAQRERLLAVDDAQLRAAAEVALGGAISTGRAGIVAVYETAIAQGEPGDFQRGATLFAAQCAACHRAGDDGGELGPNLSTLADRSTPALLASILDPNRAVDPKYKAYQIETDDGRFVLGRVVERTNVRTTILSPQGRRETLERSEIVVLRPLDRSFMPEGFERLLSPREMADLVAYLQRF
jgi:putative heme-binding domain-containing protein